MTDTARPPSKLRRSLGIGHTPVVLVADDDDLVLRTLSHTLERAGFAVRAVLDGTAAVKLLSEETFDAVVTDIRMPGLSGIDVLRALRHYDLDVPLVFVTGVPDIESAKHAVELGAFRYLLKPVASDALVNVVSRAVKLRGVANLKHQVAEMLGTGNIPGERTALEVAFEAALDSLWIAFQPIVSYGARSVYGYEALLRTRDVHFPNPFALLRAAERLDRIHDVGRIVRRLAVAGFRGAPPHARLFLNVHAKELLDQELYSVENPICSVASRVVLEITERSALHGISEVQERMDVLRSHGYRLAIDDLGAGYSGLASFGLLNPEIVKLDLSLIRGIDKSSMKQRLVRTLVGLSREIGLEVVAEGIETRAERDYVVGLGCDLLQGFFFARPGPAFPAIKFD